MFYTHQPKNVKKWSEEKAAAVRIILELPNWVPAVWAAEWIYDLISMLFLAIVFLGQT